MLLFAKFQESTLGMGLGASIATNNILNKYGWTILSSIDDEEYISNPDNFAILGATSILQIAPVLLEIFPAKYGTDLFRLYKDSVHIGFYDLKSEREVTIMEEINNEYKPNSFKKKRTF